MLKACPDTVRGSNGGSSALRFASGLALHPDLTADRGIRQNGHAAAALQSAAGQMGKLFMTVLLNVQIAYRA